ncbi:MAG: tRNA preQ1(34) S-adenosylmethionine ribosyltransferase-isomerase QueA [Proteobacteria bacterium]|jgi:S-adenosylmethionine:tRNA ribosyltransferase-isomerase|nr:tRNA preQ1(34) S-adenosylmethionine ribosyltransferase-isomerase QueA [Pseudomonadota bacterium]MDA1011382.1 tRNA preQ1(34) S-adenosylmethionine ribosyltransferase-isomerase QueA [Pseudomonadota bacterium]
MHISEFNFHLPDELIAQEPLESRSLSRVLVSTGSNESFVDSHFSELIDFLTEDDLLVFNDTRVMKARLKGAKDTGGEVEVMIDQILSSTRFKCLIRASRRPKIGQKIYIAIDVVFTVVTFAHGVFELESSVDIYDCLARYGATPLPPYIRRQPDDADADRYQTIYAKNPGAVAAPTAGLHFDQAMFEKLAQKNIKMAYLTLHVGVGTFKPVAVENVLDHNMHSERYIFPSDVATLVSETKAKGGRVCAVGTTSLRVLESVFNESGLKVGEGSTNLFITPGYTFKVVDCLITNFHLPKSTLFMLVSAFMGTDKMRRAYQHAIDQKYRFFSYGDAMFLIK